MKTKIVILLTLLIGIAAGVAGVALVGAPQATGAACSKALPGSKTHNITIMGNKAEPANVSGKLCDTLTFTNMDPVAREIAFGPHENHVPYDGVAEKVLNNGQTLTITLIQAGSFHWHDHLHDAINGTFTVTK